ncbi:hypothetical protein F4808DRAFT_425146 [Astrocystis sublimbata]|nr:hypothetical protein F4808DRAFT_425146 [Astrocystis sublimbata]
MNDSTTSNPSTGDQYPVYVGTWVNWSRGKVFGPTLTLSRRDADLLIAFTASFIAFVSSRTWRIMCFVAHRIYSTSAEQDAVYHQRQTILRNSYSPEDAINLLTRLSCSKHYTGKRFRTISIVAIAAFCVVAFTTAAGFSSRISTAVGSEVLLQGTRCGYIEYPDPLTDPQSYFQCIFFQSGKTDNAANYAQQCYTGDKMGSFSCDRFVTRKIDSVQDLDAQCPFNTTICRKNSGNIRLDTGLLDSNDHFGLNASPDQRIQWRHVLHCAPLETVGYTREVATPKENYTLYYYGATGSELLPLEHTYQAPSIDSDYRGKNGTTYFRTQLLESTASQVKNGVTFSSGSSFAPIRELFRHDADIFLAFLRGNGVLYLDPTTDAWYRLRNESVDFHFAFDPQERPLEAYLPSEPASPIGCTQQFQFCNTAIKGDSRCGPLASLRDAVAGASSLFNTSYAEFSNYNAESRAGTLLGYFGNTFFTFDTTVDNMIDKLGSKGLLSQRTLYSGVQGPIASNQWQLDFINLWNVALSATQAAFVDTAVGPPSQTLSGIWSNYSSSQTNKLCNSQKIRSSAYASFSLFGLYFTFVVGFLLIITSYLLEPVSEFLCKRKGHRTYAHLEWTTGSALQLQRLAQEEIGMGTWHKCIDTIPSTEKGELLGSLDITDLEHPVLRPALETVDDVKASLLADEASRQDKIDTRLVLPELNMGDDISASLDMVSSLEAPASLRSKGSTGHME